MTSSKDDIIFFSKYILFIVSGYMIYGYGTFSICIYKICTCICSSHNLILSIRGNCKM